MDCQLDRREDLQEKPTANLYPSSSSSSHHPSNQETERSPESSKSSKPLCSAASISRLVNRDHVDRMINIQLIAIANLEQTNKNLTECNTLAQAKLASTTKLFKKTTKNMNEAKRDLEGIYRKILEIKGKIHATKPEVAKRLRQSDPADKRDISEVQTNKSDNEMNDLALPSTST